MLANIQPERAVTAAWDMADLTYNQGIHGAQDQANALVRSGIPFSVITGEWDSDEFADGLRRLGARRGDGHGAALDADRAARLPDERHGRHPLRPAGAAAAARRRWSSPRTSARSTRGCRRVGDDRIDALIAQHGERVRDRPGAAARGARLRGALRGRAARPARGEGLPRVLGALRLRRRRRPLRAAAAARRLEPDGRRLRLRRRGRHQHRDADVRRADADRRRPLQRAVRDGLRARLGARQPHGRGQLEDRAARPPGAADRPRARHRRPRQPADDGVLGAAGTRDDRRARAARGRGVPPARRARRGPRHARAAERRDALLPFPAGRPASRTSWTTGCASAGRTTSSRTSATHAGRWRRLAELLDVELEEL